MTDMCANSFLGGISKVDRGKGEHRDGAHRPLRTLDCTAAGPGYVSN